MKKKLLGVLIIATPLVLMGAVIGYQDWQRRSSAPGNPSSGYLRMWADNTAGKFKCLTSSGAACYFDTATSGTTSTIASGTASLGTSAISSGSCASVVTVSATGVASTDTIAFTPNASIKAVTGYTPSTSGGLTVAAYPTTNNVNFDQCNWTSSSITPGAVTLNWTVTR